MNILLLLGLLLMLTTAQNLQVLYVSSTATTMTRPVYSSLRGKTLLYIKVIGHSIVAHENLVYVGTFPCKIPSDGVTATFISCETSDSGSQTDISTGFPITIISNGKSFTTSYPDMVYYLEIATPQISSVFPTAGFGGSRVNFYGSHRISNVGDGLRDMGDVVKLSIGNDLCSRFDVSQAAIIPHQPQYIPCIQSSTQ